MALDIIDTMRNQKAVYWEPTVDEQGRIVPDDYGRETFNAPVELDVYWKRHLEVVGPANSRSIVFTGVDVIRGGMMYEGTLASILPALRNNPKEVHGASRIAEFMRIPTIDGSQFVRKAFL